jgi:endonuclease/exonuclease/phosphatase family metal-dependent hydrolase
MPIRPLDGIFVRGDLHAKASHVVRSGLTGQASDHLPLVADLDLLAMNGQPAHRSSRPPR